MKFRLKENTLIGVSRLLYSYFMLYIFFICSILVDDFCYFFFLIVMLASFSLNGKDNHIKLVMLALKFIVPVAI